MENNLEVIVKESGLEGVKAKSIIEQFQDCFKIAAEWEAKAKTLVVTRGDQKTEMAQAREGRLFLRDKRINIENSRKRLKEDVLKEGRAIDSICGTLKALIEPIETYLDEQEHFAEREQERKDQAHRAEIEKRMNEENEAREAEEREKAAKLQAENDRLKREAAEKDAETAKEAAEAKAKADAALAKEREARAKEQAKADAEKKALEDKAKAEREKAKEAEEKAAEAKRRAAEAAKKKLDAEREEKERLQKLLDAEVCCPKCKHKFVPEVKSCT